MNKVMKNIQIVDSAENCLFSIYSATEEEYKIIFPDGTDIEFIEDFFIRAGEKTAIEITNKLWGRPQNKKEIIGIHGTLFYGFCSRKCYFPTKKECEMVALP